MVTIFRNHFNGKKTRRLHQKCGSIPNIIDVFKQTYDWCRHIYVNVDSIKSSCIKSNFSILTQLTNAMNQESAEHVSSNVMNDRNKVIKLRTLKL